MEDKKKVKKKSNKIRNIIILLVFIISAGVLAYPMIASKVNSEALRNITSSYQAKSEAMPKEEYDRYLSNAREYNRALLKTGAMLTDPFDFETAKKFSDKNVKGYEDLLNYDEVMATLHIPKLNLDLPVYHGTSEDTLAKAIGHLKGSSLPVGGKSTHVALTGHTGLPGNMLFTNLSQMEIGDVFYLKVLKETLYYQVDDISVILPEDISKLSIKEGEDYVTLITCTPYGVNDHRLLVRGKRISDQHLTDEQKADFENKLKPRITLSKIQILELIGAIIGLLLFVIMIIVMIRGRRKQKDSNEEEKQENKR